VLDVRWGMRCDSLCSLPTAANVPTHDAHATTAPRSIFSGVRACPRQVDILPSLHDSGCPCALVRGCGKL
jgi:hypothetical protein